MSLHDEDRNNTGDEHGTEYDGVDALMAAILDEPLPAAARQDPAFTAARDAAAADVAVLREQLGSSGTRWPGKRSPAPCRCGPCPPSPGRPAVPAGR